MAKLKVYQVTFTYRNKPHVEQVRAQSIEQVIKIMKDQYGEEFVNFKILYIN